jgi:hypothetical protein
MSDVMLLGVLRMPVEYQGGTLSPMAQFVSRAREAADRIEADDARIAALVAERDNLNRALTAAKTVIASMDERHISNAVEIGMLKLRAADVSGEREANALLTAEVERMVAERDAAVADADRYRWLRENRVIENYAGEKCLYFWYDFEHYDDVDAAIDAARQPK